MHGSAGVVTHSGCLDSAISGNPLLYPISVSDCPRPECVVLVVQIIFLQNNLFIFNLLSACLHPHTPTKHTTKPHTPYPDIPTPVYHIVIIFIIFLWYKTIFSTDPHCYRLYINNNKKKRQEIPGRCVSSCISYGLKQVISLNFYFLVVYIYADTMRICRKYHFIPQESNENNNNMVYGGGYL